MSSTTASSRGQAKPRDVFISAAANRYSHAADWATIANDDTGDKISILAYGSHRSIALAYNLGEPTSSCRGLSQLLPTPFSNTVTTLKFIATPTPRTVAFVAGAGNGQAGLWIGKVSTCPAATGSEELWKPLEWHFAASLAGSAPQTTIPSSQRQVGTVQAIGVLRNLDLPTGSEETLVAIGTSDGSISIWSIPLNPLLASDRDAPLPQLLQTITSTKLELDTALPLDIALTSVPIHVPSEKSLPTAPAAILMATASTDRKIIFWLSDALEGPHHFRKVLTLSGHDDWVRSLDFSVPFALSSSAKGRQLELASGSQDGSVRLWRLRPHSESHFSAVGSDAFDLLAKQVEDEASQNNDATGSSLSNKIHTFDTSRGSWAVSFDALLTGHESWVTGVRWHPPITLQSDQMDQPAALLSSSVDNSIILWTPSISTPSDKAPGNRLAYPSLSSKEASSSLWLPSQRFGELGVAGAGALGMFGALWTPNWHLPGSQQLILSHAWAGAIHVWAYVKDRNRWEGIPAITGHSLAAKSARWAPGGDWFLTASLDRTARLFGTYRRKTNTTAQQLTTISWHELARPQTHGYDICSAAWLDDLSFASAADEKVARIFAAPQGFVQSAQRLGSIRSSNDTPGHYKHNVLVANLPSLSHVQNPQFLQTPLAFSTKKTCFSKHKKLVVLLCSTLFSSLMASSTEESGKLAFEDVETLLRWCYATAWATANEEGALLVDIDVLLVDENSVERQLQSVAGESSGVQNMWAVEDPTSTLSIFLGREGNQDSHLKPILLKPADAHLQDMIGQVNTASASPFPHHESIALGGTFDHLHVGHKILLSMAALIAQERIVVGVTGDSMLAKKSNAHLLEPLEERIAAVKSFLTTFRSTFTPLQQDVVELADVCGPAGSDGTLKALLVTEETISGADTIDKTRSDRGLDPLKRYVIGVVGAGGETDVKGDAAELAAAKVGSTAIRKWLSEQPPRVQAIARRRRRRDRKFELQRSPSNAARPMAATAPALGLSNRAIFEGQDPETETNELGRQVAAQTEEPISSIFTSPPLEEELLVSTLWPELDKLYGHGYELLAIDTSPDHGRLTATSCKSTTPEHSLVRVYDRLDHWKEIATLAGHSLTITRIRFSPNGKWLLTVSRDRSWRLFCRQDQGGKITLLPFTRKESAHTRIIWDVAWADDSRTFATAARDKAVKVWRRKATVPPPSRPSLQQGGSAIEEKEGDESLFELLTSITKLPDAATAVAFDEKDRLAVGLENGDVLVYQLEGKALHEIVSLPRHHAATVNELAWRPPVEEEEEEEVEEVEVEEEAEHTSLLLSAGDDGAIRLVSL